MLKQRVLTAIVLLAILLGTLLAPTPWPLVLLLVLMAACALWEWLRLTLPNRAAAFAVPLAILSAFAMAVLAVQWLGDPPSGWPAGLRAGIDRWLMPAVSLIWVAGAGALVLQGQTGERRHCVWLSVFGILAVIAAWSALVQLFVARGPWFLVSLMALIWFADIAAYFTGKALGRHKLAPRVSPGKTWEGAVGGVAAACIWVAASARWPGSFGHALVEQWSWLAAIAATAFLAALSIVGDLFESLLKRRAGVKDSSQLLPGHGGVYDRIDALLPVAPLAFLLTGAG